MGNQKRKQYGVMIQTTRHSEIVVFTKRQIASVIATVMFMSNPAMASLGVTDSHGNAVTDSRGNPVTSRDFNGNSGGGNSNTQVAELDLREYGRSGVETASARQEANEARSQLGLMGARGEGENFNQLVRDLTDQERNGRNPGFDPISAYQQNTLGDAGYGEAAQSILSKATGTFSLGAKVYNQKAKGYVKVITNGHVSVVKDVIDEEQTDKGVVMFSLVLQAPSGFYVAKGNGDRKNQFYRPYVYIAPKSLTQIPLTIGYKQGRSLPGRKEMAAALAKAKVTAVYIRCGSSVADDIGRYRKDDINTMAKLVSKISNLQKLCPGYSNFSVTAKGIVSGVKAK